MDRHHDSQYIHWAEFPRFLEKFDVCVLKLLNLFSFDMRQSHVHPSGVLSRIRIKCRSHVQWKFNKLVFCIHE